MMVGREAVKRETTRAGTRRETSRPQLPQLQLVRKVEVDRSRDALLTDFGKTTLEDRYLLAGMNQSREM